MNLKKLLGKRIKELRENREFSQEFIAEKLNINHSNYWRIENGMSYPKPENLEKICDILDIKISELFQFEHLQDIDTIKNELHQLIEQDEELAVLVYKFIKTLNC